MRLSLHNVHMYVKTFLSRQPDLRLEAITVT